MLTEQKINKKLIIKLRDAETYLHKLSREISVMANELEFPIMVQEVIKLKKLGKLKEVNTEMLQKKFKIGYIRSSELIDELRKRRVIK